MTATLGSFPVFRAFDADGAPLVGGLLYSYAAGTTTPLATYVDQAGVTTNANPVVLDANGEANVWLSSAAYKFVLKDSADVTQWTVDNIYGPASQGDITTLRSDLASTSDVAKGDALIGVKQPFTNSVARTQDQKNADVYSLQDAGIPMDGTSDCSAALAVAMAAVGDGGKIVFPAGTFKFNIEIATNKRMDFEGFGQNGTILMPYSTSSPVFQIDQNASWDSMEIRNLTIKSAGNVGTGIRFGHATASYVSGDEYAGRVILRRVKMLNFGKCIERPRGNLGVYLERCTFETANYHIWTYADNSPMMHGGAFHATDCHFQLASLAHHYIDSSTTGTGDVIYTGCTHEANPGFVFFIKNYAAVAPAPGFFVDKCWNEANYTSSSLVIDGVTYTQASTPPVNYAYIANATNILFTGTPAGPMTLVASDVLVQNANIDMTTAGSGVPNAAASTVDSASTLIFEDTEQDLSINMAYNRMPRRFNRNGAMSKVKHRSYFSSAWAASATAVGKQNCFLPITFGGTGAGTTVPAVDGVIGGIAQDLTLSATPGQTHLDTNAADYITCTSGNYQVYLLTYKLMSGAWPTSVQWAGGVGLSGNFQSSPEWITVAGIAKSGASSPCYLAITSAGAGVLRLGGYFIVEFATKQKALEFLEAGVFPDLAAAPKRINGAAAPTTGTWAQGDIVYNTAPASAGYIGWTCTVAGTPGTWKTFGLIS